MSRLILEEVGKRFPNGHIALGGVSLTLAPGEAVAIVGGSGCGKSTLLRMIAGLDSPTSGRVLLDGAPVTGPSPKVGVVFQEPRLMPWLSVAANVGFGLPRAQRRDRVPAALRRVGLAGFADALPRQLSGGMAQRAALARALVTEPEILLLDEPFSALDALLRTELLDHVLDLWSAARQTLLLVTHDIEEALVLADRVVVMRGQPGRVHLSAHIDLPRPRVRAGADLQQWRRRLLDALHDAHRPVDLPVEEAEPALMI